MKRYILLGIGIGIIITNILLSLVPKETVDINKIVEEEVQKRLKRIESLAEVEETFKEAVEIKDKKVSFPKEIKPNAVFYVLITKSKNNEEIITFKEELKKTMETKIELIGDESFLFSNYPYTKEVGEKILKFLDETYQIRGQMLKDAEVEKIKKS